MDCTKCKYHDPDKQFCAIGEIQCNNRDTTVTSVYGYCAEFIER